MRKMLSPSLMCADLLDLRETLQTFERCGVEYLHIDVMDGEFVPNLALGTDFCRQLKARCPIPLDFHLMLTRPEYRLDWFPAGPGDLVSVHAESTPHLHRALEAVRARGARPLLALNPATPLAFLEQLGDAVDGALVMTVDPGFAGQKMIPATVEKVAAVRAWFDNHNFPDAIVEVDGNVNPANARRLSEAGANLFVGGSSGLFAPDVPLQQQLALLRAAVAVPPAQAK